MKESRKDKRLRRKMRKKRFTNRFQMGSRFQSWWFGAKGFTRSIFRVAAAKQLLVILVVSLLIGYGVAAIYTGSGEFIISVDRPMAEKGFYISDTTDFSEKLNTLTGHALKEVDNISIFDIDRDVFEIDGEHNGHNYIAYTFYLKNKSKEERNYQYQLKIRSETKGIGNATWVMVSKNGVLDYYAKARKNGDAECQYSEFDFPFMELTKDATKYQSQISNTNPGYITDGVIDYHRWETLDGVNQLKTTPFKKSDVVLQGSRKKMEAEGIDKYTVVIWLEGEDPECVNDILGGEIEMAMNFYN